MPSQLIDNLLILNHKIRGGLKEGVWVSFMWKLFPFLRTNLCVFCFRMPLSGHSASGYRLRLPRGAGSLRIDQDPRPITERSEGLFGLYPP